MVSGAGPRHPDKSIVIKINCPLPREGGFEEKKEHGIGCDPANEHHC